MFELLKKLGGGVNATNCYPLSTGRMLVIIDDQLSLLKQNYQFGIKSNIFVLLVNTNK